MQTMFQDGVYKFVQKVEDFRCGQTRVFIADGESYLKKAYIEDSQIRLVSLSKYYKYLKFSADSNIELTEAVVI